MRPRACAGDQVSLPVVAAAAAMLLVGGCGAHKAVTKSPTEGDLPIQIEHEPCDVTSSQAEKLDSNGDGRADIVRVMAGAREVCKVIDLNHDGRPDAYI